MASNRLSQMSEAKKKLLFSLISEFAAADEDEDSLEALALSQCKLLMTIVWKSSGCKKAFKETEWRDPSAHVRDYVEKIVPTYSEVQFREHFRMDREIFEELCEWIGPYFPKERTMTVEKKILATIWLISNPCSFRDVADRFGLNKGRLHHVVMTVCRAITDRHADVIEWPAHGQLPLLAEGFAQRCGMSGVVGAIDGTHIKINGPSEFRSGYINRHGDPSIQLQVVCDANLQFLDVYTGWPGSVHDARVFRSSPLKHLLEESLPPQYHLLGDSAYPLSNSLMVPFRDYGQLSVVEKRFNSAHSSTRVEVERSIGLLKGKFRRLKYLDMTNLDNIPNVIFAACAIHNFIILHSGIHEEDIELEEAVSDSENENDDEIRTAADKRLQIAHILM